MLTRENIRLDINVREIYLLESALQHEKDNIGLETLLRKYEDAIEDFREDLPFEQFCYLLGYLEYFDPSFKYDKSVRLDGFLLDGFDQSMAEDGLWEYVDLDVCWNKANSTLRDRGFLYKQVDEVY